MRDGLATKSTGYSFRNHGSVTRAQILAHKSLKLHFLE